MRRAGWAVARDVEIVLGRSHGWIDLPAFDRTTQTLVVIEIEIRPDDIGATERQIAWHERSARDVAARLGWLPGRILGWVVVLARAEVDALIRRNRDLMSRAFPVRADAMSALLAQPDLPFEGRGVASIDPGGHRERWLLKSRADGRRSTGPYADHADAARRLGR